MSPVPVFPPDRFLLVHERVNFHMHNNPRLPMFVYADDQALDHPTTEITFLEFGRAAHRIAHVVRPERAGEEDRVVMLIANCDTILFHAATAGMLVAGLVPFLVSPRNSAAAVVNMMKKTNCSRIMTLHHAHSGLIENIRQEIPELELVVDELPTLSNAFPKLGREVESDPFTPYPAYAIRPDLDSPSIYMHSSGSTGFPKPIAHSHRFQACWDVQPFMQSFVDVPVSGRVGTMSLPPFHAYGLSLQLHLPLVTLLTAVLYAPRAVADPRAAPVIPTTDNMLDYVRWTGCKILMTVPTFLEQWALSEKNVEQLRKLDLVVFSGGPLSETIGDALCAAGVGVATFYAGTEFGCPTYVRTKADILKDRDWNWMHFSDDVSIIWAPNGDDTYECQVLASERHPVAIQNLPDVKGYATSDLWAKHPTKNLWKIVGRADDVIILATGEKTVPAPMEGLISASPFVQSVVMFGRERNQVGILVEPYPEYTVDIQDGNAVAEFRNKVWPLVDEANRTAPAFSRIFKEMILVAAAEKPVLKTPKGSIRKKATIKAYEAEIDDLYHVVDCSSHLDGFTVPSVWTAANLEGWLMELANTISDGRSINARTDLFAQGFDSLSTTYLRNKLLNAVRTSANPMIRSAVSRISQNIVFENPTIELLATRVASLVNEDGASLMVDQKQQHIAAMNAMIEKYSSDLPKSSISVNGVNGTLQNGTCRSIVLLTGSTGGLGSFLLAQLIENPGVEKVYALNRPSSISSGERQKLAFIGKGLSIDLLNSDKLVYVETDVSGDRCGLPPALYDEIRGAVTTIIHNAWRLDFNLSLASFEPNIKSTRNLVDLALASHHERSLRFVFTSSVGSAQSWGRERGAFPERVQLDPSCAVGPGYGEAKHVCERILAKSGLRATSLRIGQITGGPNGSWATTDWVPIMVKSSIALGAFPNSHGVVSWMPVEEVAASVLDIAFAKNASKVLNIVNPQRPSWSKIISSMRDAVLERRSGSLTNDDLPMVSFADWVSRLEQRADSAMPEDLANTPAIKLLEFFRGMAKHEELTRLEIEVGETGMPDFSTAKAQRVSKALAHMRPVGDADAHAWIDYWSSMGLF